VPNTATEDTRNRPPELSSTSAGRRLAAVDAFIDLVLERSSPPTPEEVADRAGVSRATFFRYFATVVELRNEAATRVLERFPDLFTIPAIGTGNLEERIRRFVDVRIQLHETLHPLELLMRSHAVHDADTADFIDAVRQLHADQARQHFDTHLQPHSPARRDDMVAAIAVLTSVESWQQFRHTLGRSPIQTRRAWRIALAGIFADVPASSGDDNGERHAP
jgi:AcrR family transcriptional regulator